jgi:hypothetical protein
MCLKRSLEGRCFPSVCYGDLYKKLYPAGGYYARITEKGDQLFLRSQKKPVKKLKET